MMFTLLLLIYMNMNETELRYLHEEMDRIIRNIEHTCKLIDNYQLNNSQEYLNWLDRLNELSVRN